MWYVAVIEFRFMRGTDRFFTFRTLLLTYSEMIPALLFIIKKKNRAKSTHGDFID